MHMPSCLGKAAERQQPLRCSIKQPVFVSAFHNPGASVHPSSTVTFTGRARLSSPHSQEAPCCQRQTSTQRCQHRCIIPLMPRRPLAQWLLINPEPPGTGRGLLCQTPLGHHPPSFITTCLFTEDLAIPFEKRSKWPGQKSRGHSIAGATGSAAGMLHRLGTQDWIPSGKGSILPL